MHLKCFGSTFLVIQICSKLIFTTSYYQLEILCFSYDTPLHLLGFVSTEDDVVMDEKREKRKINCGTEKRKHKSKNHKTVGTTTFKTKVLIINAATKRDKFMVFGRFGPSVMADGRTFVAL